MYSVWDGPLGALAYIPIQITNVTQWHDLALPLPLLSFAFIYFSQSINTFRASKREAWLRHLVDYIRSKRNPTFASTPDFMLLFPINGLACCMRT